MTPYAVVINGSVMETVSAMSRRDKDAILRIFRTLENDPFQPGDYASRTPHGQILQVKKYGAWMIKFWPDHAVKELRVVYVMKLKHFG
jgi:hypothetical protein